MSSRTFYDKFLESLTHNFPHPIDITWSDGAYLVSSAAPSYSGAVPILPVNEEGLREYLRQKQVPQEVINKVVEILPGKRNIKLCEKSYIGQLPSPQHYDVIGDWVILYDLGSQRAS
jgi:hypothetical protein